MTDDSKNPRRDMPPVPRDYHEASFSELVPLKSTQINIFKSPIFYMVMLTGLVAIFSFGYMAELRQAPTMETFTTLVLSVISYMLLIVLLVVFLYTRTDKPFWVLLIPMAFVALLLFTPLGQVYFFVFREILPGRMDWALNNTDFVKAFIGMFFAAGLCEELMKVTLVMACAYIGLNPEPWRTRLGDKWYEFLRVRGPLDGLLMGLFGGAGFILIETGMEYLPRTLMETFNQTGNAGEGIGNALMLLMPRTIGGMVGHMAWAGITGYFIGLCVIRPGNALKIFTAAWVGTSVLHAMWNTSSFVPMFTYLSAGLGGAFLVACLLKARQMEMSLGRTVESYGSIVVGAELAGSPVSAAGPAPVEPPPAAPQVEGPAATTSGAGQTASPQAAAPATAPAAQSGTTAELRLLFDAATVPVKVGPLDLSSVAGGAAINAEVTQHPSRTDVLGLKNLGQQSWTATLRDGSQQEIASQRNIRLADGVKIDFGSGVSAEVMG